MLQSCKTTIIEKNAENNPLYCGVNSFDATDLNIHLSS